MQPNLQNIFKELASNLYIKRVCSGLTDLAKQWLLLLNPIMTFENDNPLSHQNKGWEKFTNIDIAENIQIQSNIKVILDNYVTI